MFWKKALCCDNMVIRILAIIGRHSIGQTLSKYSIRSINIDTTEIKHRLWKHFVVLSSSSGEINCIFLMCVSYLFACNL